MRESVIHDSAFIKHYFAERLGRSFRLTVYWRIGRFKYTPTVEVKAYDP